MEWISVQDKLPADGKEVIVCTQWGGIDIDFCDGGAFFCEIDSDPVTHWLPLPEPPNVTPGGDQG